MRSPSPAPEPPATGPAATIDLSPSGPVTEGTEITVTMSFANLEFDSDTSDTDYIFRADVVDADECENQAGGYGLGVERYMYQVDEDPEVRAGTVSAACPAGDYTVRASIASPGQRGTGLGQRELHGQRPGGTTADAGAALHRRHPERTDAERHRLWHVRLGYHRVHRQRRPNDVAETTVTPTANHDGATYAIKLNGVADEDGVQSPSQ